MWPWPRNHRWLQLGSWYSTHTYSDATLIILLSVCVSVRPVNINIACNFWSMQGAVFIFYVLSPWIKPSRTASTFTPLWPWPCDLWWSQREHALSQTHVCVWWPLFKKFLQLLSTMDYIIINYNNCFQLIQSLTETGWNLFFFFSLYSACFCSETRSEAAICDRNTYPLCITLTYIQINWNYRDL